VNDHIQYIKQKNKICIIQTTILAGGPKKVFEINADNDRLYLFK